MDSLSSRIIKFARELYRRRVPRMVAAYALASAAAVNLADILSDVLTGLPEYTTRLVVALLIVGFPVAVALSWALDIASGGIVRTPTEADPRPRLVTKPSRRRNIATIGMVIALVFLVILTVVRFQGRDRPWRPDMPVAVIPVVSGFGEEEAAVADAFATLVATRLESAGWSTVDGARLRPFLQLPIGSAGQAAKVGAGFFVDVRIDLDGEMAAVRASLFSVEDPRDALKEAQDAGSLADALKLVDRTAAQLTGFEYGLLDPFPSDSTPPRVAVMPAEVVGPEEQEYLREAVATVLATRLEQAGWPASDSRSVFGVLERNDVSSMRNPHAEAARKVYADFYVETRIEILDGAGTEPGRRWPWQARPEIRAESRLYSVNNNEAPYATASAQGRMSDLTRLVGQLGVELTRAVEIDDPGSPLADDVPTGSLAALKAFIEGDRHFRGGNYESAAAAFNRAVAADTLFALAFYRLSIAAEWAGDVADYNPWKERGVKLAILTDRCGRNPGEDDASGSRSCPSADNSRRLTWRTRLLAEARRSQQNGDIAAAERLYTWIRVAYPDDYEATFQLAEILFHNAPLEGRDALDSDPLWQRVLGFQSGDFGALLHVARLDALADRLPELLSVAASALEGEEADTVRRLEMEAYVAFAGTDSALMDAALRALEELDEPRAIWTIGGRVAMYNRNVPGGLRILRLLTDPSRGAEARVLGHITIAHLLAAQGRLAAARRELALVRDLDPLASLVFDVSLLAGPFSFEPARADLEEVREQLLTHVAGPPGNGPITELTVHDSVYDRLRLFALGIVSLRLGRESEAVRYMSQLGSLPTGSGDVTALGDELGRSLRMQSEFAKGNLLAAEQESDNYRIETASSKLTLSPFFAGTMERFLRARIFGARGRVEDALKQFSSFSAVSVYDLAYLAPAHLERARLLDARGDESAAAFEYERFVELWRNADPELLPLVQRARDRLRVLNKGA